MMKKILLSLSFLCFALICSGQNMFTVSKGEVSFYSHAPIEDISAENKQPASVINLSSHEIAVIIPIRNFRFEKELMQQHFNEKYMESEKYPMASFKGVIENIDLTKDGEYEVSATGVMSIHGVEKEVTLTGTLKRVGNMITITSKFKVALKDYNITIPKLLFENIAEIIEVTMSLEYKPKPALSK